MEEIILVIKEHFIDAAALGLFKDLVDIAVISTIIYYFLKLLKGTEAIPVVIGLILISLAYQFFALFKLNTAQWLFSTLSQYTVLILIIIFRDDIRKTLARIGRNKLLHKREVSSKLQSVEELIKATQTLSKKKIGALILIQMDAQLEDIVTGQIPIDSWVRKEMIEAIFHHHSPIHDGAMIINEDRIRYAGAFLPLSLSRNIPAHLGTRHRAGIGISEQTDVIALIVSEETGNISIAYKGVLKSFVDSNELRESLHTLFLNTGQEQPQKQPA